MEISRANVLLVSADGKWRAESIKNSVPIRFLEVLNDIRIDK